ncbi:hypothetical protein ACJA27_03105 [Mycoplasmopsis lipophila]|uniref:hypothetical protein n=1 Tax=Mycoplasmopsis lipophila TaxID=2117 RepID=UPI003872BC61
MNFLASNIGSLTNPNKLINTFNSIKKINISKNTINSYLNILEDSFLITKAIRYDIKEKNILILHINIILLM